MPFLCKATILAGQLREDTIVFDAWIDEAWRAHFVEKGTAFAAAHDSRGPCVLRLNCPGSLVVKSHLRRGDPIRVGDTVAEFAADGESIPYGRASCVVDYSCTMGAGLTDGAV